MGDVKGFCHKKKNTGSAAPVRRSFYRTSPEIKKQIQIEVDKLLQAGIIEPSEMVQSSGSSKEEIVKNSKEVMIGDFVWILEPLME